MKANPENPIHTSCTGRVPSGHAADIALVDNRLDRIVYLRLLSHQTLRIIAQNHWFAISTDLFSTMMALTRRFTPMLSGIAHLVHTLVIGANSSRRLYLRPKGILPLTPTRKCGHTFPSVLILPSILT